jgi:SNF2 family DNA or RNA helicase
MAERQLYEFQRQGISRVRAAFAAGHSGFLLYDEMGLGKTIQALAVVDQMKPRGPVLVVGPKSCLNVWNGYQNQFTYELRKVGSTHPFKNHDVVVVSYNYLVQVYKAYLLDCIETRTTTVPQYMRLVQLYDTDLLPPLSNAVNEVRMQEALCALAKRELHDKRKTNLDRFGVLLFTTHFSLVILDEAHLLKNCDSKTSKAVGFLSRSRSLALTGTPIMNHGDELQSILRYGLCSDTAPLDEISLGRKKCDLPELQLLQQQQQQPLAQQLVRLSWTDDIEAKECYDRLTSVNHLALTHAQRQLCLEPLSERKSATWTPASHMLFPRWVRDDIALMLLVLLRVARRVYDAGLVRLWIVKAVASAATAVKTQPSIKMYWVDRFLRQPSIRNQKVVCICTYRKFLEEHMAPYLTRRGFKNLLFAGDKTQTQQQVLTRFTEDNSIRVLLLVKSAGALGLNLQAAASVCVIMDPHFNGAQDDQAAARVDRIGQTREITIRRLVLANSVDSDMLTLQGIKSDRIASALY